MPSLKKIDRVAYFAALTVAALPWVDGPNVLMCDVYDSLDHPVFSFDAYVEAVSDALDKARPIEVCAEVAA